MEDASKCCWRCVFISAVCFAGELSLLRRFLFDSDKRRDNEALLDIMAWIPTCGDANRESKECKLVRKHHYSSLSYQIAVTDPIVKKKPQRRLKYNCAARQMYRNDRRPCCHDASRCPCRNYAPASCECRCGWLPVQSERINMNHQSRKSHLDAKELRVYIKSKDGKDLCTNWSWWFRVFLGSTTQFGQSVEFLSAGNSNVNLSMRLVPRLASMIWA